MDPSSTTTATPTSAPSGCPDPLTRATRLGDVDGAGRDSLQLAPPALQGALVALVSRDTRGLALGDAQRLTHYPASTLVSISWFHGVDVGLVERTADGACWTSFGARVVASGSQSRPITTWAPTTGRGYIAIFNADAAHALFGLDLGAVQDRFVPVEQAIGDEWRPLWDALRASKEADLLAVLEHHLAPRWQALYGRPSAQPSLRQLGRHWIERLAWHAHQWRREHSPRHVERRIKSFSGRSMREWQTLVRTEGLFFAARDRQAAGQAIDWAELAQDEGFADQAHMIRTTRRITGFSPTEFGQRFEQDESFWLYRLWV